MGWRKQKAPFLTLPPPGLPLAGWRDPFIVQRGDGNGKPWVVLIGSGIKDQGGTTLVYTASDLSSPGQYAGLLCLGDPTIGAMWECPLLWPVKQAPRTAACGIVAGFKRDGEAVDDAARERVDVEAGVHIFAAAPPAAPQVDVKRASASVADASALASSSPRTSANAPPDDRHSHFYCISPDGPYNSSLYWLGCYDADNMKFRLQEAAGPYRLDMGDTIYAPNVFEDGKGRSVLWAWAQEHRSVGTCEYAGCMTTPRVLLRRRGRLVQQPLPELAQIETACFVVHASGCRRLQWGKLRRESVAWPATTVPAGVRMPLEGLSGAALDMEVVFERSSALISGISIACWSPNQGSAAILYDWESSQLEVVFEGIDPQTKAFSLTAPMARRVGGRLEPRGLTRLALRVILDHSLLEVYAGTGQVITTRVYRGAPPAPRDLGIDFLSLGGATEIRQMNAWEISCIWDSPQVALA